MIAPIREWSGNQFERAERFVVLQLDEISLVVAQTEIVALEPVLDVKLAAESQESDTRHEHASGYLPQTSGECSVFALNAELQCLAYIPETHRICAVMRNRQEPYSLSCVAVHLLSRADIVFHATPRSMLNTRSPVLQLMVHSGRLLLGTTAAAMYSHLTARSDSDVISFEERSRRIRS